MVSVRRNLGSPHHGCIQPRALLWAVASAHWYWSHCCEGPGCERRTGLLRRVHLVAPTETQCVLPVNAPPLHWPVRLGVLRLVSNPSLLHGSTTCCRNPVVPAKLALSISVSPRGELWGGVPATLWLSSCLLLRYEPRGSGVDDVGNG